jgi:uncharacterized protein (TIGR03086 family)
MDAKSFERAVRAMGERMDGVPGDRWSAPSPCAEWDVKGVANHVVNELLWVPPLLAGQTIAEVGDRFDGDVLGDDPAAAYHAAAAAALDAANAPGAQEAVAHLSFGDFSGADYLDQIGTDLTIHTWDLSRGSGQSEELDPDLAQQAHDYLAPFADAWRGAGAFGPAVEVASDARVQDRLLAISGRRP